MKWQPIETAPIREFMPDKWYMAHSPYLLAWNGHCVSIASYHYTEKGKGRWRVDGRIAEGLTHWRPMPEGPTQETGPDTCKTVVMDTEGKLCGCYACSSDMRRMTVMITCQICGNKRCPRATSHEHACTSSNEPGQPGSRYQL
jgi:hypothetical protein